MSLSNQELKEPEPETGTISHSTAVFVGKEVADMGKALWSLIFWQKNSILKIYAKKNSY